MGKGVRVLVPATTANLGAGFDCLGMALNLYNVFDFELGSEGFTAAGEGEESLRASSGRLIYRAWQAAYEYRNQAVPPVKINLKSNIPIGRGLGSSATAIIAGLFAANYLGELALDDQELLLLATEIEGHPDNVAPALLGGLVVTANGDGDGQRPALHYVVLEPPGELQAVLAVPAFELSTAKARSVLPKNVSRQDAVFNVGRAALLVAAWSSRRWDLLGKAMEDRLHQPMRAALVPGLTQVLEAAEGAGALGAALSGAGPSVIALTLEEQAAAVSEAMERAFSAHGIDCKIIRTTPARQGAYLAD
ncbi:MAG: homoserine kinase [Firmicutes bacterium]|nr:homoserine kinase [Bacillota bacterium]